MSNFAKSYLVFKSKETDKTYSIATGQFPKLFGGASDENFFFFLKDNAKNYNHVDCVSCYKYESGRMTHAGNYNKEFIPQDCLDFVASSYSKFLKVRNFT